MSSDIGGVLDAAGGGGGVGGGAGGGGAGPRSQASSRGGGGAAQKGEFGPDMGGGGGKNLKIELKQPRAIDPTMMSRTLTSLPSLGGAPSMPNIGSAPEAPRLSGTASVIVRPASQAEFGVRSGGFERIDQIARATSSR